MTGSGQNTLVPTRAYGQGPGHAEKGVEYQGLAVVRVKINENPEGRLAVLCLTGDIVRGPL